MSNFLLKIFTYFKIPSLIYTYHTKFLQILNRRVDLVKFNTFLFGYEIRINLLCDGG